MKNFISLGAGVQSSTMALMAAVGDLTPMPDAAIFADTQAEPASVYKWLNYLESELPFPVYRATFGNLGEESLEYTVSNKSGKIYTKLTIPVFVKSPEGTKGMLPRRCTQDYKIKVIEREYKRLLGIKRMPSDSPVLVKSWIGISFDEAHRMKSSRQSFIENRWPLLEEGMSRQDCLDWMEEHGFPQPPRSACVFCPYHSDTEWVRLRDEEPEEFQRAVEWEERLQETVSKYDQVMKGTPFLHASLKPLTEVEFKPKDRDDASFDRECEGMCGL